MAARSRRAAEDNSPTGMTVRDQLENLRRIAPKRSGNVSCPQLHASDRDLNLTTKEATLYVYIRSSERTYALHETLFHKSRAYTALEWQHFFGDRVLRGWRSPDDDATPAERDGILRGSILPGVNLRTQGKQWSVVAVVGYVLHAVHESPNTAMVGKRNKTKPQRQSSGQTHIRRRHGNRARKAK